MHQKIKYFITVFSKKNPVSPRKSSILDLTFPVHFSTVRVLHGIPLLIGGTSNMAAVRTMEEINQWVTSTSGVKQDMGLMGNTDQH
jgi:hypothetical protein